MVRQPSATASPPSSSAEADLPVAPGGRPMRFYGGRGGGGGGNSGAQLPARTDLDTLRETYRFIRSENDDADGTWEQRLARRYHDKLFKEYCIADMSRYKENKARFRYLHPWLWM
eukprot:SM000067S20349  [mRNA]  locus=s67:448614:449712:- [translate_table: standard]